VLGVNAKLLPEKDNEPHWLLLRLGGQAGLGFPCPRHQVPRGNKNSSSSVLQVFFKCELNSDKAKILISLIAILNGDKAFALIFMYTHTHE